MTLSRLPTDLMVHEVAKRLAIGTRVLYAWEHRYGWPRPLRLPNGYRMYSPTVVSEIQHVVALLRAGHRIGTLIVDGSPRWPSEYPGASRSPTWSRLVLIDEPDEHMARVYRTQLVRALKLRDVPTIVRMLHQATRLLRPEARLLAAWLPAYVAAQEWAHIDRPLACDVHRILLTVAGDGVLAAARTWVAEGAR